MNRSKEILNHVAIPLGFDDDILWFYNDILGFNELYRFVIDRETARLIFGSDHELNVTLIEKDGFKIELFRINGPVTSGIAHICLTVSGMLEMCLKAEEAGYKVIRIERPSGKIAFLTDKTGNRFEIKENKSLKV
jgi:catechol 2,3-dioxygenase-like lactoylglutathione lyase family enzyme